MVELAGAIIAPSHQRQHRAGVRIHGYQRHLRHGAGRDFRLAPGVPAFADYLRMRAQLLYLRVHFLHSHFQSFRRGALQSRIERGVDAISAIVDLLLVVLGEQRVFHQINKVWRFAGFFIGRRQLERDRFGALHLLGNNGAGLLHGVQHQVAPLQRAIWVFVG